MGLNVLQSRAQLAVRVLRRGGGVHPRECPICDYTGLFEAFGDPPRWDARCPKCRSLERHRLLSLYLDRHPGTVGKSVVHFAPEPAMAAMFRKVASDYRSADLNMNGCDLQLNIEKMVLPDESADTFVVSHVLEHVDDRAALAELHRCLRPGGNLIAMIPIVEGWASSYENPALPSDKRELHFGQWDHVRVYGRDFRDRVRDAGFALTEWSASGAECVRYGLQAGETVFVATKVP